MQRSDLKDCNLIWHSIGIFAILFEMDLTGGKCTTFLQMPYKVQNHAIKVPMLWMQFNAETVLYYLSD